MLTTLAAAQETSRGWGGPIALAIVAAIFVTFATVHDYFQRSRQAPSPTLGDDRGVRVNSQVSSVSDTDDTEPDTGWWGRIVEVDGRRVRAAPAVVVDDKPADDELDLDLEEPVDEPEPIEDVIARMEDRGMPYMEIVRHIIDEFEVSESTAKRSIREVRAERSSAA